MGEAEDKEAQYWFCEECHATGTVFHDKHADVMSVMYLISDDHREKSPACLSGVAKIRVAA